MLKEVKALLHRSNRTIFGVGKFCRAFNYSFLHLSTRKLMTLERITSPEQREKLLRDHDTFVFDCDGVLWEHNNPIKGASQALDFLVSKGKAVLFITNNSSKSRKEYAEKFTKLGFSEVEADRIFTSGSAACQYAKEQLASYPENKKKVFYVGNPCFKEELDKVGLQYIAANEAEYPHNIQDWVTGLKKDPEVGAVIVGADWDFSYRKSCLAATYLVDPDVLFIGTNEDKRLPTSNRDIMLSGTGSIIAMVEAASGRKATYVGKPEQFMFRHVVGSRSEVGEGEGEPGLGRCVMVGDSLNTDIQFGAAARMHTLLVETGNHTMLHAQQLKAQNEQLSEADSHLKKHLPTYVASSVFAAFMEQSN